MGKNLYVGNLSFDASEESLRGQFEQYGTVESCKIITDRETGRSRGFGFVEMDTSGGEAAIQALNGTTVDGRELKVNEAKPREPRTNNRW